MASGYTSADLLDGLLLNLGRGNGGPMVFDELFTEARCYTLLSQAQMQVYRDFLPITPWVFVSVPWPMETNDGGITYEIPGWMFGHTEIYAQESGALPLIGTNYGDPCGDFTFEGSRIRMRGNRPRTFAAGPYARYCGMPGAISPARQPDMQPEEMRELILWRATYLASMIPQAMIDGAPWKAMYDEGVDRWTLLHKTALKANPASYRAWSWQLQLSALNGVTG